MKKVTFTIVLLINCIVSPAWSLDSLRHNGYVVVSPKGPIDGGDFGPNTPGTTTAGFQEAFEHAKDTVRQVYIVGGPSVVYNLDTTLCIPWGQDWYSDGGDYVMNFRVTSGDCINIDSQMNCRFKFGVVTAPDLQSGSIVHIQPRTVGPDNAVVCVNLILDVNSITGSGASGCRGLQSSNNTHSSDIKVGRIENCDTGISILQGRRNTITCSLIRNCNRMLYDMGGLANSVRVVMDPGGDKVSPTAAIINNIDNIYYLTWRDGFDPGKALILGENSGCNLIFATNLPSNGIASTSNTNTNRIIATKPLGFDIATPTVLPSSSTHWNETAVPVIVTIISPGSTTGYILRDSNGISTTINQPVFAGQTMFLAPADGIQFTYTSTPPTWVWRALR